MHFSSRAALALIAVAATAAACHAHEATFKAILTGVDESPSNGSPAVGVATVFLDLDVITMNVHIEFSGLVGTTTAANINAPTAQPFTGTAMIATQVPSFDGFPLGVTGGVYDHTFDLTVADSYNPAFITAMGGLVSDALNNLDFAMDAGKSYVNIPTSAFPGGEIRGFLVDINAAPEPASLVLVGLGVTAFVTIRRRRRA